jgi:hypothetical protein
MTSIIACLLVLSCAFVLRLLPVQYGNSDLADVKVFELYVHVVLFASAAAIGSWMMRVRSYFFVIGSDGRRADGEPEIRKILSGVATLET